MKIVRFFPNNGALLRRLKNLRDGDLEDEDPATTPSVEFKSLFSARVVERIQQQQQRQMQQRRPTKRLVRFADEQHNQIYESIFDGKHQCRALWYSGQEYSAMRQQMHQDVMNLRHLEKLTASLPSWAKAHVAAYQAFCHESKNAHKGGQVFQVKHDFLAACEAPAFTIGLEKRAILPVFADTVRRRKQITVAVVQCQAALRQQQRLNGQERQRRQVHSADALLRQVSRQMSRPSRLYAHHIAVVTAACHV